MSQISKEKCTCTCHLLIGYYGYKPEHIKKHHCCPRMIKVVKPKEICYNKKNEPNKIEPERKKQDFNSAKKV